MTSVTTTIQDWDKLRTAFASSIMVDTSLYGLAQNLEGPEWPVQDKDETPARYIDLSLEEAVGLLERKGMPAENIDLLASILRETLSFDQPFGEMVRNEAGTDQADDTLLRNLTRFGVPQDFPLEFTGLDEGTREICRLEKLDTIGAFARAAREMSGKVIVGGDFRALLNALSQADPLALSRFLPIRPGSEGIHLPEAIALILRRRPRTLLLALAKKAGMRLNQQDLNDALTVKTQDLLSLELELDARCARLTEDLFKTEFQRTLIDAKTGTSYERIAASIGDPLLETLVAGQLRTMVNHRARQGTGSNKKAGFWARLFRRA